MIRDVVDFRETGLACRRVAELNIPVKAWRAAMRHAGGRAGTPVCTFLLPAHPTTIGDRQDQLIYAVRTHPAPDVTGQQQGLLWWRRVDQLDTPLRIVRVALRRFARGEGVRLHTFLAPQGRTESGDPPSQLVYAVWAQPGLDPFRVVARPPLPPAPLPVTDLADYTAARVRSESRPRR
jgi:hypothetical protein